MLAALLTLLAAAAPATPPAAAAGASPAPAAAPVAPAAVAGDVVIDTVLPCGLRVLTARDMSLPVAAVVLAIETGSEDDPADTPGLVHALAYQVVQGNRELRPGESIAVAQDAGGFHGMATGLAQVRYESLVPVTRLDAVLWVEAQRLRFPTTAPERWLQALSWAAGDEGSGSRLRPEAVAHVHGAPGLGHDGRVTPKTLGTLSESALATHLAAKFAYPRATLVVVAPEAPEALLARVTPLFADLPPSRRTAPLRRVGPRPVATPDAGAPDPKGMSSGTVTPAPKDMSAKPATVPLSRQRGYTFVWAVPPTPAGGAWAAALCRAIDRQKKAAEPEEPRKARLDCDYEADPRRGVLLLRPSGAEDPWSFIRARLARFAPGGADQPLLQAQAATIAQALRLAHRTPYGLAQQLALIPADDPTSPQSVATRQHRVDDATGVTALADPAGLQREAPGLLRVEDAVVLTHPEAKP